MRLWLSLFALLFSLIPQRSFGQVSDAEKLIIQAGAKEWSKDFDEAEKLLSQALGTVSITEVERAKALMQRGKIRLTKGKLSEGTADVEEAIKNFSAQIAADPKSCLPTIYRGMSYRFLNQHEKSLNDLNRGLELCPVKEDILHEIEATKNAMVKNR